MNPSRVDHRLKAGLVKVPIANAHKDPGGRAHREDNAPSGLGRRGDALAQHRSPPNEPWDPDKDGPVLWKVHEHRLHVSGPLRALFMRTTKTKDMQTIATGPAKPGRRAASNKRANPDGGSPIAPMPFGDHSGIPTTICQPPNRGRLPAGKRVACRIVLPSE